MKWEKNNYCILNNYINKRKKEEHFLKVEVLKDYLKGELQLSSSIRSSRDLFWIKLSENVYYIESTKNINLIYLYHSNKWLILFQNQKKGYFNKQQSGTYKNNSNKEYYKKEISRCKDLKNISKEKSVFNLNSIKLNIIHRFNNLLKLNKAKYMKDLIKHSMVKKIWPIEYFISRLVRIDRWIACIKIKNIQQRIKKRAKSVDKLINLKKKVSKSLKYSEIKNVYIKNISDIKKWYKLIKRCSTTKKRKGTKQLRLKWIISRVYRVQQLMIHNLDTDRSRFLKLGFIYWKRAKKQQDKLKLYSWDEKNISWIKYLWDKDYLIRNKYSWFENIFLSTIRFKNKPRKLKICYRWYWQPKQIFSSLKKLRYSIKNKTAKNLLANQQEESKKLLKWIFNRTQKNAKRNVKLYSGKRIKKYTNL